MDELKILYEAKTLIEKGWCNDGIAKHKNLQVNPLGDTTITPNGKEITTLPLQWSMTGAILAAEDSRYSFKTQAYTYLQKAAKEKGFNYFSDFEGVRKRTQEECIALFEEAIAIYIVEYVNENYPNIMERLGPE